MDFLSDWHQEIMQVPRQPEDPDALRQRLRIACGLSRLPIWQKELQRISAYYESSLPEDPVRGWVRDGSRIILGDMGGDFVKVLDGDEALLFQLEHAGMNKAEVGAVRDALYPEAD